MGMKTLTLKITSCETKTRYLSNTQLTNNMLQRLKQKTLSLFGSASGGAGFLGSVPSSCHNLCTGFISLASLFGISLSGMPLAFLPAYSTYFWTAALLFLILMAFLHKGESLLNGWALSALLLVAVLVIVNQ